MNTIRTLLAAALLTTTGAALADPPDHAPAVGYRAKQQYVYYPSYQIYFEPAGRTWYWRDHGTWTSGAALPPYLEQFTLNGVTIDLDTDKPYTQHATVMARYGKGSEPISPKDPGSKNKGG